MRRLNIKLTLWLVGISVFSIVGVHFLHAFQLDRNADFLRVQAEKAREDGNFKEAVKQYNQYLKHRDDPQGYSVLAELVVQIAKDEGATRQDKYRAYAILEEAIRRHQDLDDVRRRLVDYTMQVGRYTEALEHIQYLFDHGAKGSDLDLKIAKCYFALGDEENATKKLYDVVGYDEKTEQFASSAPPGAQEPSAFELLAHILRRKTNGEKLADALMSQLVAWNDSAKAHLARATYLINALNAINATGLRPDSPEFELKKAEVERAKTEAKSELDRAFELAPDDVDVILAGAVYAVTEKNFAKSQELLDRALKEFPERQEVYLRLAQLKLFQNDVAGAAEQLQRGLKDANEISQILEKLVDLQFQLNDLAAFRTTYKQMQDRGTFPPELLRFEEARLKFLESNYLEASREFEAVRPAFLRASNAAYAQQIDILLGQCYELLGLWDRELELYRGLLQKYPDLVRARLGEVKALQNLGKHDQTSTSLAVLTANAQRLTFIRHHVLQLLINDQLQKPDAERDWTQVEAIASMLYEDESVPDLDKALLKADLLMLRNEYAEAQKILAAACKQHPKETRAWATLARSLMHDDASAAKLPSLFKLAQKEVGDVVPLRVERIRAVARKGGDQAPAELAKLEQGLDQFTEQERLSLMLQLGAAYLQVGDVADGKRCWKYATGADPKNSATRQFLFEMAFDEKDQAGMRDLVKELHDSRYFGPQSPLYKYCAATEMLLPVNLRRQAQANANAIATLTDDDRKALAEARKLIDEAIVIRGEWSALWRVRGEIDQLEGDIPNAIANYQRALEFNRNGQGGVAQRLVKLLYATNRVSEGNEALKHVGLADTSDTMRRTAEDLKFKSGGGGVDEALKMAKTDVEKEPNNPLNHIWYGQFLERAAQTDEAEKAYRKAIEVDPSLAQAWDLLVRRMVANKKAAEAADTVREAAKPLAQKPAALAKLYERIGDNEHAEHFYQAALEADPGDLLSMKALVEFYFGSGQSQKAIPYLDQIIEKTAKSTDKANLQILSLARRFKAKTLASTGDYEQMLQATKLIEQNAKLIEKNGKQSRVLAPDDTQAIVMMLAVRPEPSSRAKAIALLEDLPQVRPLEAREQSLLGQLYERTGQWDKGRDMMVAAITRRSEDVDILFPFAQMLIRHNEFDDASRWVDRLEELLVKAPPASPLRQSVTILRARLLVHNGQKEEAVKTLNALLPRPVPQSHLALLEELAKLMEEMDMLDAAEKLLTEYVGQEPRGMAAMAAFLSRRGQFDRAFEMLEQARKSQPTRVIMPAAIDALRRHPELATKERFQMLEGWAKSGIEEESDPQQVELLLAELYDLQGNSQDAINVYRQMLASPRVSIGQKALVKNNLAFLLAVTKTSPDNAAEGVKLIDEAIRVLGPTGDLLDTRAVTYMAAGKVEPALADVRAALADSPTSSKYFHLAQAEKQANHRDAAREALAKAQQIGIVVGQFGPTEQKLYAQLVDELR